MAVMCKPAGDEIGETMKELAEVLKGAVKVQNFGKIHNQRIENDVPFPRAGKPNSFIGNIE